jgi:hypothetical protein
MPFLNPARIRGGTPLAFAGSRNVLPYLSELLRAKMLDIAP